MNNPEKTMKPETLFAGVAVSDFETAKQWYERFFDRRADVVAHDTEVMWQTTANGWLYIARDLDHAGHSLIAIAVPNIGDALSALRGRGIESGPIERQSENAVKAVVIDPDGNSIGIIEAH
jgi:predicted enzyme related to lactoylglutathione lyase